jgi:hypothetical protein
MLRALEDLAGERSHVSHARGRLGHERALAGRRFASAAR